MIKPRVFIAIPSLACLVGCGHRQNPGKSAVGTTATTKQAADSVQVAATSSAPDSDSESSALPQGAPSGPTIDSIPVLTDSQPLVLDRPTLVAFFVTTQAQLDSFPDEGETLSDFQYYLPLARDSLARMGVALTVQYRDTVVYRVGDSLRRWSPAPDSGQVGYVLLRPAAPPRVAYGLLTDDILSRVTPWLPHTARLSSAPPSRPAP